ncbi:testicular haploid expressed gene protein-like isoform X2 [Protopterus annectens]|uniref:testicular haploid expressed gene protein-like isoform X2 n=1 Tax=Protopterus annectens TaxID=7888 RepID=UPI001CF9C1BD|nr:testicular haploid expressed gene protein-like isoform X2 [Protopterus annectens]
MESRLEYLATPKKDYQRLQDKPPIWPVTSSAMNCNPTPRVMLLAQAKQVNQNWQPDRSVYSEVSERARTAIASPRIIQLSQPKSYDSVDDQESDYWIQSARALAFKRSLNTEASPRLLALATPKDVPKEYLCERPVQWLVSEAVKNAAATERVIRLAKPKTRRELYEGFDPYKISSAAKHTTATPRLKELCMPLPRKMKHKV